MGKLAVVVLAAGQGKRMHSALPKVLHRVLGEPMLAHVLRVAEGLAPDRIVVVTGHGRAQVEAWLASSPWRPGRGEGPAVSTVEQVNPNGTGHAVLCAQPAWHDADEVLVLYGDVPLLREETLAALRQARSEAPLSLLAADMANPTGYGRVLAREGWVERIVEHKDASESEREVRLCNAGMMCLRRDFLAASLGRLRPDNAQGELYLTDLVGMAAQAGTPGRVLVLEDAEEVQGVNNRAECALATGLLRRRLNRAHMLAGVAIEEPETAWIEASVALAADCVIGPSVELRGNTSVSAGAVIERGCVLTDVEVAERAHLLPYTVASESRIGSDCHVGPFAHLRPGTVLGDACKVGNFVETKKTHLGRGAKASHLSYLGDADIGPDCNIGAGTITCNYDGKNKFRTVLGRGVFIGSDTQLVAPVNVGEGAYVGAGTTVTGDVPAGALALSRTPQRNIEGWVARKKGH
jgi:bifunctional UDP-N-acetylglucosamine pyrophosphorylase/glucosamine-1-phosphate N-acetyltransferase